MRFDVKRTARCMAYHGLIMLRGLAKVLYGAAVAGLVGLAVYGFRVVPSEGGYGAVCDFIGAIASLAAALGGIYAFGCCKKKNGRILPRREKRPPPGDRSPEDGRRTDCQLCTKNP